MQRTGSEEGRSYGGLIRGGIEAMSFNGRPSPEEIQREAQRMYRDENSHDEGSIVARRGQEVAKQVRQQFEQVVRDNDPAALKGTLWEKWTVEDCRALLSALDVFKGQVEIEEETPLLFAASAEERLGELENFIEENRTKETIERAITQVRNLLSILNQILGNEQSAPYFKKKYEEWTEDEMLAYRDRVKEHLDGLVISSSNMIEEGSFGDY
ncbi:MAG: hypothetical protein WC730_02920 [Patescibacteria group bacterium]|jgi:hypothetical protein